MHKKIIFILFIVSVAVVCGALVGAFYLKKNVRYIFLSTTSTSAEIFKEEEVTLDDVFKNTKQENEIDESWSEFVNEKYGIAFYYPSFLDQNHQEEAHLEVEEPALAYKNIDLSEPLYRADYRVSLLSKSSEMKGVKSSYPSIIDEHVSVSVVLDKEIEWAYGKEFEEYLMNASAGAECGQFHKYVITKWAQTNGYFMTLGASQKDREYLVARALENTSCQIRVLENGLRAYDLTLFDVEPIIFVGGSEANRVYPHAVFRLVTTYVNGARYNIMIGVGGDELSEGTLHTNEIFTLGNQIVNTLKLSGPFSVSVVNEARRKMENLPIFMSGSNRELWYVDIDGDASHEIVYFSRDNKNDYLYMYGWNYADNKAPSDWAVLHHEKLERVLQEYRNIDKVQTIDVDFDGVSEVLVTVVDNGTGSYVHPYVLKMKPSLTAGVHYGSIEKMNPPSTSMREVLLPLLGSDARGATWFDFTTMTGRTWVCKDNVDDHCQIRQGGPDAIGKILFDIVYDDYSFTVQSLRREYF